MKAENLEDRRGQINVIAADWKEIIQVICAYGYRFAEKKAGPADSVGLFQTVWELVLNYFGKDSRRQGWEKDALRRHADWLSERLRLTHWCVGHIVHELQRGLAKADVWVMNVDYTGMGTAFFKTDIEIRKASANPERFVVIIDPPHPDLLKMS